jgi:hypothetical protein
MSKLDELISGKQSELDKLKTELLRAKIENEKLKKSQFQENHE